MRKLSVALTAALALAAPLMMPVLTRPTAALESAEAVDQANAYPNVGSIMTWRAPNNPLGLPGGLATGLTAVLIDSQTLLTAGHFAARAESFGTLPPWLRIVVSFAPNALDQSTWIDLSRRGTCIAHPSFPKPCTPQSCPFDDTDGLYEPGISDVGLCFLDEPVLGIRPAKLANGSLDKKRIPGTRMTIVGYGSTAPAPGGPGDTSLYDGIRRWGTSTVDQVIDQHWVTFNRDPVGVCYGDSGAPTFFKGRVVAVASDGAPDCVSADNRARVDSKEVRKWIKSQIDQRFPF
jgi:Trypsin